eukprot:COSAG02_NODE_55230_length_291_cov_1.708333_1_plen_28_part_01
MVEFPHFRRVQSEIRQRSSPHFSDAGRE